MSAIPATTSGLAPAVFLVFPAKKEESASFRLTYESIAPLLFATAFRITANRSDSESIVAHVFTECWSDSQACNDKDRNDLTAWSNRAILSTRTLALSRRNREEPTGIAEGANSASPAPTPHESLCAAFFGDTHLLSDRRLKLGAAHALLALAHSVKS